MGCGDHTAQTRPAVEALGEQALEAARDTVVSVVGTPAATAPSSRPDLVGHIGTHVLQALLPERRMRLSARMAASLNG